MNYSERGFLSTIPPVVKNLIIINVIMSLVTWVAASSFQIDLTRILGLYPPNSPEFRPYQIVTHMFMHAPLGQGGIAHIFFNMFALFMFGRILEQVWGGKRFFIYYLVTGLGAAVIHSLVNYIHFYCIQADAIAMLNTISPQTFAAFVSKHFNENYDKIYSLIIDQWSQNPTNPYFIEQAKGITNQLLQIPLSIPTVGASGAVFGVLLAFGMLFPNTILMLLIPPIPIKAKWMVIIYGGIELFLGLTQPGSNIAHFAHLGGMIFGFILIKYWRTRKDMFY